MRVLAACVLALAVGGEGWAGSTLVVLDKAEAKALLVSLEGGRQALVATIPTGNGPHEVAVSPDGATAWVANYGAQTPGSTLTVLDLTKRTARGTFDLGEYARPHGIVPLPGGKLLVTSEVKKAVAVVDGASGKILRAIPTDQDGSHMVVASRDGRRAYTANIGSGSVSVLDIEKGTLVGTIPTAKGAEGIDLSPDGRTLWVTNNQSHSVSVIDTAQAKVVATIACPGFPIRARFTPDGARVLVTTPETGELVVYEAASRTEQARIRLPALAPVGKAVPVGVLVDPAGTTAFVSDTQGGKVILVDLQKLRVTGSFEAGSHPDGLGLAMAR